MIRRQISRWLVEIRLANLKGINPQLGGNMLYHPFNADNPLRPTKTTVSGVGLGIGAQTVRKDGRIGQVVGVIGVQHGPVGHGVGKVQRPAALEEMLEDHRMQLAIRPKSRLVFDAQIMALAGDQHIIIAVIAHFGRAAELLRHHSTAYRQRVALRFLTAKATAHAAGFNPHGVEWHIKRLGHFMLNLSRVLGG